MLATFSCVCCGAAATRRPNRGRRPGNPHRRLTMPNRNLTRLAGPMRFSKRVRLRSQTIPLPQSVFWYADFVDGPHAPEYSQSITMLETAPRAFHVAMKIRRFPLTNFQDWLSANKE